MAEQKGVSRRAFLQGAGGAALGGLVVGGGAGYLLAPGSSPAGTGVSAKGKPITIGSISPTTGSFSFDGQMMHNGQLLAVEELNASGGVLGSQVDVTLIDEENPFSPSAMIADCSRLISSGVAAIFAGWLTVSSSEFPEVAKSGMPFFHVNTYQPNLDFVKEHGYTNIFEGDPSNIWYGGGFIPILDQFVAKGIWKPRRKTMALLTNTDPYNVQIVKDLQSGLTKAGWRTTLYQEFTSPVADWTSVLTKIRQTPPDLIFIGDYLPGDISTFTKQFRQSPTPSILYEQFGPSTPQYLSLTGTAANGVMWSTVTGTLPDDIGTSFKTKFQARFGTPPDLSVAGNMYDLVHIWARAVEAAGDPYDFKGVVENVQTIIHRGVNGAYTFTPGEQAVPPYPDQVADPSLGMPHLTYQIQDMKQVLVSPAPYASGQLQLPPWFH